MDRVRTDGAEEDAGVGSRQDRLKTNAVTAAFPEILSPFIGHTLGHGHGADPSGLKRGRQRLISVRAEATVYRCVAAAHGRLPG